MSLLYHAYVYLEFLILACTIYILAPYRAEQISKILKGVQWCEWINKKNNNILTALSTVQRNKVVNMECNFERRCVQKWSFLKEDVYKSGVF